MDMMSITLNLPADLAKRAADEGLLEEKPLADLIQRALEATQEQKTRGFFQAIQLLAEAEPLISPEDIEAEIQAYRASNA
jgi:hypothetical protein